MGNLLCCAAPSEGHANVYGRLVTDETQTFNTCNGLLVKASTASWAANHPCEDRHLVHFLNDSSVLIGVFDGMGGPEAAQLCKANAALAFEECLNASDNDVREALAATFLRLDSEFFATDQTLAVKAYVGAEVTLVHVDFRSRICTVASHGSCLATKGIAQGGFKGHRVTGKVLDGCGTPSATKELARLHEAFPHVSLELHKDGELLMGLSPTTRAIGLGVLKRKDIAEWHNRASGGMHPVLPLPLGPSEAQYVTCEPFLGCSAIAEDDQAITLGSSGLWRNVSPTASAAWCFAWHQLLAMNDLAYETDEDHDQAQVHLDEQETRSSQQGCVRPPSLAAGLVLHGLATAAACGLPGGSAKQRGGSGRAAFACVDDLEAIPCARHTGAQGRVGGVGPTVASRASYHGDMTCVSLSWRRAADSTWSQAPSASANTASLPYDERPVGLAGMRVSPLLGSKSGPRIGSRVQATKRWEMLRSIYRFLVTRRRTLLDVWRTVADSLVKESRRAAFEQARQAEVEAWRTEGRVIKVSELGIVTRVDAVGNEP